MIVIAIFNIKGGVGKTSTAVNLGYLAAEAGQRTLLWDLDPQGATSFYLRIKPRVKGGGKRLVRGKLDLDRLIKGSDFEGLDLLPADFSYRKMDLALSALKKRRKRLKRLLSPLVDCPPGMSLLSESIFQAADLILVPTIPTTLSLRTLKKLNSFLQEKYEDGPGVLPFFSMVDRRKTLHREIIDPGYEFDLPFLNAWIPASSVVEKMGINRMPVNRFAPRSAPAKAYRQLWEEIFQLMRGTVSRETDVEVQHV